MRAEKIALITLILVIIGYIGVHLGLSITTGKIISISWGGFSHSFLIPVLVLLIPTSLLFIGITYKYFSRTSTFFSAIFAILLVLVQVYMGWSGFFFPSLSAGMYASEDLVCMKDGQCDLEQNKSAMICEYLHRDEWAKQFGDLQGQERTNAYSNARKNCNMDKEEALQVPIISLKKGNIELSHVERTPFSYGYQTKNGIWFERYSEPKNIHYNGDQINWILWKIYGI